MAKSNNSIFLRLQIITVILVTITIGLFVPESCQASDIALLLQKTPEEGGVITPGAGVHNLGTNTQITLTATPKPGYQFVYWLGDVSDPTANSTILYANAPKIVIAVFERLSYEFTAFEVASQNPGGGNGGGGGGGFFSSAPDIGGGGGGGGAGARRRSSGFRGPSNTLEPEPDLEPEPEPEPDIEDILIPENPEPIPEPATIVLFGLGALVLMRRRR